VNSSPCGENCNRVLPPARRNVVDIDLVGQSSARAVNVSTSLGRIGISPRPDKPQPCTARRNTDDCVVVVVSSLYGWIAVAITLDVLLEMSNVVTEGGDQPVYL